MWQVLKVFVYGAWKHRNDLWHETAFSWDHFENKVDRHRVKRWMGEDLDPETQLPHHAHACCDLLMAMAKDRKNQMPLFAENCVMNREFSRNVWSCE